MLPRIPQHRFPSLLLGLLSAPLAAIAAMPGPTGREVVVTGAPDERPPLVYSAADVPVVLVFDAELMEPVLLEGAEVRRHPSLANALQVTPTMALASRSAAPLRVSLKDGVVALSLVFGGEKRDQVVHILRRPVSLDGGIGGTGLLPVGVQDALRFTASVVLGPDGCRAAEAHLPQPVQVLQVADSEGVLVCAVEQVSYIRVRRSQPDCVATTARLLNGQQAADVLLLEEARPCIGGTCHVLAVSASLLSAPEERFELQLVAADGTLCERRERVQLTPGAAP